MAKSIKTPTARNVHKRGYQKKVSLVTGRKFNGAIACESMLEASLVALAELDPRVVGIRSQPFTLGLVSGRVYPNRDAANDEPAQPRIEDAPRQRRLYTPDFELTLRDRSKVIIEVRHSALLKRSGDASTLPAMLSALGHTIRIVTDELLHGAAVYNAKFLKSYLGREPSSERASILHFASEPISLRDLAHVSNAEASALLALVAAGHLRCDLRTARLTQASTVCASNNQNDYLELIPL